MDKCIRANAERVRTEPDSSALSFMVNAKKPIPESQIIANVKIAIGGGINEPRDALLTILYGLLTNPDQLNPDVCPLRPVRLGVARMSAAICGSAASSAAINPAPYSR